jgi:hypothetical protein
MLLVTHTTNTPYVDEDSGKTKIRVEHSYVLATADEVEKMRELKAAGADKLQNSRFFALSCTKEGKPKIGAELGE